MPKYMPREKPMEENKSKEGMGALNYPILTKSNYTACSLKMSVFMNMHSFYLSVDKKWVK